MWWTSFLLIWLQLSFPYSTTLIIPHLLLNESPGSTYHIPSRILVYSCSLHSQPSLYIFILQELLHYFGHYKTPHNKQGLVPTLTEPNLLLSYILSRNLTCDINTYTAILNLGETYKVGEKETPYLNFVISISHSKYTVYSLFFILPTLNFSLTITLFYFLVNYTY